MTNEKAINILLAIKKGTALSFLSDEAIARAVDIAISALEFRERYDKFWEEVKSEGKSGKETEIHHSGRSFRIREVAQ